MPVSFSRASNPALHPISKQCYDGRFLLSQVVVFQWVFDQVIKLDGWFEVEIGFESHDQFPLRGAPAMFSHPGAFRQVELAGVGGNFAFYHRDQALTVEFNPWIDLHQLHQGWHQVLVHIVSTDPFAGWKFLLDNG